MKITIGIMLVCAFFASCNQPSSNKEVKAGSAPIVGTWQLISGTLIEKGDTAISDYTKNQSFIKVINDSHFAFLKHSLLKGKEAAAEFSAGGGSYTIKDSLYTENLEYCNASEWEGHKFEFVISIKNDTLVQTGIEKLEKEGINRLNIEKYVRVKK
jgi:hypothetical protein